MVQMVCIHGRTVNQQCRLCFLRSRCCDTAVSGSNGVYLYCDNCHSDNGYYDVRKEGYYKKQVGMTHDKNR